jgi:DNA-binding cell septation regulator SpoVG
MTPRPPSQAEIRGRDYLAPRQAPAAKIRRWQPFRNPAGTVLGFLSIEHPSGLIIHQCKLMVGAKGARWVATPAVRETDNQGNIKLDINSKPVWQPIVEFRDKPTRQRWQDQILEVLRKAHPEVFDDGGEP